MNDTIDEYLDFLQNKTIKMVGIDDDSLVIVLSDGSRCHLFADGKLYIALERHIIN